MANTGDFTFAAWVNWDGGGSWQRIFDFGANTTSYANTGLPPNTSFYYRVYAHNDSGDSGYTNVAMAKTFGNMVPGLYLPLIAKYQQTHGDFGLPIHNGFEAGQVPPSGWTLVQTNPRETWKRGQIGSPYEGYYYADCEYDDGMGHQNEVLLSPLFQASSAQLQFHSFGNLFWCRDAFDNCDLNIWLVVGDWGGGNDIYVRKADNDWSATWDWSSTTINLDPFLPAGTPVRVGFQYEGQDGAQIGLDAIHITP